MADRLRLAGGLIETPYAVMLGDDEFHLPTGLSASVETLEKNEALVGCMGQVLSFSPLGRYRRSLFARAYPLLNRYDISHLRPEDRLIAAMSSYNMATSYAVLRTPVWRKSWGSVEEYGSGVAAEIQQAMAVYLLGPFTTTSHVQWLRSIENPAGPVSPHEKDRRVWFPEWWESDRYGAERSTFIGRLAESVAEELSADRDKCTAWVMAGGEVFVEENRAKFEFEEPSRSLFGGLVPVAAKLLRTVARYLPDPLFLGAKRWRGRVLRLLGRSGGNYYGTVEDLPRIFRTEDLYVASETVGEIALVEVVVREFHELRSGKPD
jgi:hypothetical protein